MSNELVQKPKFSVALQTDSYKKLINNTLQDPKRAQRFIASISSAVAVNPVLQECDAGTILSCALLGESLELSPSPQLGQYYLVPFDCAVKDANGKDVYLRDDDGNVIKNKKGYPVKQTIKKAQFILGYKGYIQLAIRSGMYKKLNVVAIKKGELIRYDVLNEEIEVHLMEDELQREVAPTEGYFAMFEYTNGFKKALYWSASKMEQHALRYSPGYANDKANGYSYTFWTKDFDGMAYKTMLRQLISKWGIMSIEMRMAFEKDDSVINQDGTTDYVGADDIKMLQVEINDTVASEHEEALREALKAGEEPGQISINDL